MFYALIRKELRLHRMAILIAIAVALVAEGLLPVLNYLIQRHQNPYLPWERHQREFGRSIYQGSGVALMTACLFAAVFGGGSTATERRERWADFAAMLPVPRRRRWFIAATVGATLAAVAFAFHATILFWVAPLLNGRIDGSVWNVAFSTAAMSVAAFGLARLAAVWMRSPSLLVVAVCGTLVAGLMLAIFVNDAQDFRAFPVIDYVGRYLWGVVAVGVLALIASFSLATRRVEP